MEKQEKFERREYIAPTIEVGQRFKVEFTSMTHDGQGVCKINGKDANGIEITNYPVFVPFAITAEQGMIELIQIKKDYGLGKIVRIFPDKKSPYRTISRCPHYPECGGCNLMHLNYDGQLIFKQKMVKETLQRLGSLTDIVVNPVIGMNSPWFYRNKVQVPFGIKKGKTVAGFFRANSHDIIPLENCYIQSEEMTSIFKFIKNLFNEFKIKGYDEEKHRGDVRHVLIRESKVTSEIMVVFVCMTDKFPNIDEFCQKLLNRHPKITSLVINVNKERTNEILGKYTKTIYGNKVIHDILSGMNFSIGAKSFYQVNHEQTEKLYEQVLINGHFKKTDIVIDAYSGIGTIGLLIAPHVKHVYGVEIVEDAIRNAIQNAKDNYIENITFVCNKAENQIVKWHEEGIKADVMVVDPPRKGCDEELLKTIVKMQIPNIIYVSCDPGTLSRDLQYLTSKDYHIKIIQPVDLFPQTTHVETLVLLCAKNIIS